MRSELPGPLLIPLGLAVTIVAGDALTRSALLAPVAAWLLLAAAAVGLLLGRDRLRRLGDRPAWIAAALTFAAYGAPIVLSGEPTFAGYVSLDDTATWLAITDRLFDAGNNVDGLDPSTYLATLSVTIEKGYPVGSFIPFGAVGTLTGAELAWAFQPYLAFLAATLALAIATLLRPLIESGALRAIAAIVAAQPALLFAYGLWSGIKELTAAALIAALWAILASRSSNRPSGPLLAGALVGLALLSTLSLGGIVWLIPAAAVALLAEPRVRSLLLSRRALVAAGALGALVAIAALAGFRAIPIGAFNLLDGEVLGNLVEPLEPLQIVGIWPAGDFRLDPEQATLTWLLIALAALSALAGAGFALRRRAFALAGYGIATVAIALLLVAISSPWLGAKTMAIASPAVLALAVAGAARLGGGRLIEGGLAVAVIAVGVGWSNLLAADDARLAPYERLAELERIGSEHAGAGPTLLSEYEPYGARHLLREMDAEATSELRVREIALRNGKHAKTGTSPSVRRLRRDDLLVYRTLVVRRDPRPNKTPPPPYELLEQGRFYEVWTRATG